jgi:signal transduction histidine kinase
MLRGNELIIAALFLVNIAACLLMLWVTKRLRQEQAARREEQKLRDEMDAYAGLDPAVGPRESPRALAKRVCATVVKHSAFRQVAMLMRDAESRLHVVGSAGVDDLMALEINGWVARFARERRNATTTAERLTSFPVTLAWDEVFDASRPLSSRGLRQVMILPLWSQVGEMLGALVVWPSPEGRGALAETLRPGVPKRAVAERVLLPLEALTQKLGRAVDVVQMSERLARAEKMAGLGQLAKGVAHELNNPLTAVLGFAELIVATTSEQRVREDAVAIAGQAMRMRDTVGSLLRIWRPVAQTDSTVDVARMLRGLVEGVKLEMKRRGVKLELQVEGDACLVRGDDERLLEVFEHLLNNAAQAVAGRGEDDRSIRMAVSCADDNVRVVVTDSGAGFVEPARVFDPFYTTRQTGKGQGMGLAVSYGIVREHGGEISAFNVHPHGAAMVVELPAARVVVEPGELQAVGSKG